MLTDKQKLFADEYLIDLNATRAYKAIYKNVKSDEVAKAAASRLLTNVNVAKYIEERMKDREKRTEITQDMVLKELAAIAFTNGSDFSQVVDEPMILNGQYVMDPDTGKLKTWETVKITPTDRLPEEKKKAIAGIKMGKNGIEVSTCDKVRALELLGKHLGMFTDNIKLRGDANTEITIKIGGEDYGD
ncbi:MAG: terminase small subunit [Herbinix sp.]|jgi:phage terminase small subunit|nr:terminase small subunit [Herbinix sp.]